MKYQKNLVNKFNMILDNQGRVMLSDQKIPLLNEPQRSPGFVQKQPPEVFCKKGVLKNNGNFTRKHLCWSPFLITLQFFRAATLLKRYSNTDVFLFCRISAKERFHLFHVKIL